MFIGISFRGPKGLRGDVGFPGFDGIDGLTGERGETGEIGKFELLKDLGYLTLNTSQVSRVFVVEKENEVLLATQVKMVSMDLLVLLDSRDTRELHTL